jgi:hypothetical protein
MLPFLKKYSTLLSVVFLLAIFISLSLFPSATPVLGIVFLLFSLAIAISSIFKKHKQAENPRPKIAKDILILILTLLLIIFLGGLAGMFANHYASLRFGAVVGLVTAMAVSFVVGYFVKKGVGKIIKSNP